MSIFFAERTGDTFGQALAALILSLQRYSITGIIVDRLSPARQCAEFDDEWMLIDFKEAIESAQSMDRHWVRHGAVGPFDTDRFVDSIIIVANTARLAVGIEIAASV